MEQRQKLVAGLFSPGTDIAFFKLVMLQSGLKEKPWRIPEKAPPNIVGVVAFSQIWSPSTTWKDWIDRDWATLLLTQWEIVIGADYDEKGEIVSAFIGYEELGL